ncbi:uncharacterized protein LOC111617135 isoform X1 [Centruroides sculpturatus]|uniref:uncharacterized protein LOC111617135 isoform X1 n=1 Tax=Centruroides sculpturatus TaxID=218467 RepID=UPI000C6E7CA2|nr:uncharacterized protein LOC111617135 isoform X1 [Centruroides sculpturatus]
MFSYKQPCPIILMSRMTSKLDFCIMYFHGDLVHTVIDCSSLSSTIYGKKKFHPRMNFGNVLGLVLCVFLRNFEGKEPCSEVHSSSRQIFYWNSKENNSGKSETLVFHLLKPLSRLLAALDKRNVYELQHFCGGEGEKDTPLCFLLLVDCKRAVRASPKKQDYRIVECFNVSSDIINHSLILPVKILQNVYSEMDLEFLNGEEFYSLKSSFTKESTQEAHVRRKRSTNQVPVQLTFDADYSAKASGREAEFKDHIKKELAKAVRIPLSSIKNLNLRKDKMSVDFNIVITNDENNVMDDKTLEDAAIDLKGRIHRGRLKITDLESNVMSVIADESVVEVSTTLGTDLTPIVLGIVVGIFILIFILVILSAMIVQHINKSCNRSVSPYVKRSSYQIFENDDSLTGRDSMNSLGKYSYVSGVWIGPGREPKRSVPEAPLYRPPTVLQIRETPRPCTAVRVRLKDDWNIDPEKTFGTKLEEES